MDILEIFNASVAGPVVRQLGMLFSEPEVQTRAAARSIGPALMAGLLQQLSGAAGPSGVFRRITDPAIDAGVAARLQTLLADRGNLELLLQQGESLSGFLLGVRSGSVAHAIADSSGLRLPSAVKLLSLGAPLMFGILKKYIGNNDLDASALATLLQRQGRTLARSTIDDRLAGALGFGSVPELLGSLTTRPAARATPPKPVERAWMPWAAAAAIAVVGMLFFVNRTAEYQETPTGAVQVAEIPQDDDSLRAASAARVYFESGDAQIDAQDRMRIASVAQSARNSDRHIAITGYADTTGDEDENYELARDRAWAVRDALVDEGVAENQIVMDPPKPVTDTATMDEARRVDVAML
jgi:outer membrane protein OmpA-like peptidoglycan-associated protein